jgi:hypothetical protein
MAEREDDESLEANLRRADDLAAAAIREDAEAGERSDTAVTPSRRRSGPILGVVCLLVVVSQLPSLRAAFQSPPSIRIGGVDGDEHTNACIDTLWKVSGLLQYGTFRGEEWVEPLSQRPYDVRHAEGDTVVECPNPAAHNLRSVRVSRAHRAPEALP